MSPKEQVSAGKVEDHEDLIEARKDVDCAIDQKPWYKCIGPGFVTGAADDDPSGVGTYSANGAQFGYVLLWLVPFCIPLMIAVQEMCARMAQTTGKGLAATIKRKFPKLLLISVGLVVIANLFNVYADLNIMAASTAMLFGIPNWVGTLLFTTLLVFSQLLIPYRKYASLLKWLCLSLLGYVIVAVMPGVRNDWPAISKALVLPHLTFDSTTLLAMVAFLGTTISPYLFFWQAGETVEEQVAEGKADRPGKRNGSATENEIKNIRADTTIGMVVSQLVAFFIIVAAAGTLHATGKTQIDTAQDAANALKPLGPSAFWVFSLCMIGTGLIAIPTLAGSAAYSLAETFGWRYGLYRRFSRAKAFYLSIATVIVLGGLMNLVGILSPIKALIYSAALNGLIAPPLILIVLLICNDKQVVGKRTNGPWSNLFGSLAALLMGAASIYLVFDLVRPKH